MTEDRKKYGLLLDQTILSNMTVAALRMRLVDTLESAGEAAAADAALEKLLSSAPEYAPARERLVEKFGGDLDALWQHIHAVEQTLKDRIVRRDPKRPEPSTRKVS